MDEGVFTWGFFMLGFPTETRKELWSTLRFAFASRLHGASFFTVIPYEGTELTKSLPMADASRDSYGAHNFYTQSRMSKVSPLELSFIQTFAFARFFFDPRRFFRIYKALPNSTFQGMRSASILLGMLFVTKPAVLAKKLAKQIISEKNK